MEESTTASPVTEAGDESPAQKQARIRRERREAKIKAGGSARLDKITQLSGRPPPDLSRLSIPPPYQSPAASNDPDEVDITNHPYTSSRGSPSPRFGQNNGPTEADLRQLLRSGAPPPNMGQNPFMMPGQQGQGDGGAGGGNEDPMMRILQQMMGGISGGEGGAGGGGLPPELAAMLGGGGAGGQPQQEDKHGYLWSIIHGLFALSLGIYTLGTYQFDGSRISRTPLDSSQSSPAGIFWIFTTVELILQSSRFFLEKGAMGQRGMLAMVANFLPMPWKGYVALISRYGSIYTRVVEDAMVIVFVLGLVAWWQGAVA
ncbi:hypothetical protein MMC13_005234 [Lambiella insularis]|nr:hypothetical protein [Lambiella insularis]